MRSADPRKISFWWVGCKVLSAFLLLILFVAVTAPAHAKGIGLFVGDVDAAVCVRAAETAALSGVEIRIFTEADTGGQAMAEFVKRMDVAVVDIMQKEPGQWLLANRGIMKEGVRLYAVRQGRRPQDYLDAGFLMDKTVRAYFDYTSTENLANLLKFVASRDLGTDVGYDPPITPPKNALYHPDAPDFFQDLGSFFEWYRASGRYRPDGLWDLTVIFPTFTIEGKKEVVDALMRAYEREGINVVAWMQEMKDQDRTLERLISSPPLAGRLGSISGFAFKFSSSLSHGLLEAFKKADVPVFNIQTLFFETRDEWLASPQGISTVGLSMQFITPELSGLVEPTVVSAKERVETNRPDVLAYRYTPVTEHIEKLARRVSNWHRLRQKPNKDKKIVIIYYNHAAGKQNIGASYLNVFRSISEIIRNLKEQGYTIEGELTEETVKDLLLRSGRNIGSWAPDELDQLVRNGNVSFVEMEEYSKWLSGTPIEFQKEVEKEWGRPEDSKIMVKDGRFVIPCVRLGNLILAPQPVRGWGDDPEKLYHSTTLPPHHQYNAFYYWLQEVIRPDAIINLGTHGTHEWLPGKQAGLTWRCPPEVLIGDIPSLYPYIVDDVGEGIQAKRRGRAVVIDHAVPPFKKGGLYEEYTRLAALIGEYSASSSEKIRTARLARIQEMSQKLGLDKDLEIKTFDEEAIERIEHYLIELKTHMIPYGLHTFGVSPSGEALSETAGAIASKGGRPAEFYAERLTECGPSEMASLIRGLKGGYIPPASGNDPIRNPESLPTGKDFYGFDPEKVPSKEAWAAGEKAALELIDSYREKHGGNWPEQVGLVLWSVETIRDEGINVATALALMGMRPVWDERDKVKDVQPIPAAQLNRPRIDVLLQMSGLFRDTFPQTALMLDKAVNQAAALSDVENFIKKHSEKIEKDLISQGRPPEEAKKLSMVRLYSAPPGAYGTKVDDMTGASGLWEDERQVAEHGFIEMQSYGYSAGMWGEGLTPVYRMHLKNVDATVHTISSNLYGTMDNDDMFQYLGGLSMAVRKESGRDPEVFVSMQRTLGDGKVEPIALTLGRELRSRYLNPKWIEGMKQENYAGAREMAEFMENMWGWQVTTPGAVDAAKWQETYEVYVEDKYGLDIKEFFNRENPWAWQSMTARMLEAVRKGYWKADEKVKRKLAAEYAMNVAEKGVACCDHTCNNPLLNQIVAGIISIPGLISPEIAEKFRIAVEKAAGKTIEDQVRERRQLLSSLEAPGGAEQAMDAKKVPEGAQDQNIEKKTAGDGKEAVEGYKMEEIKTKDEEKSLTSSGVQWFAILFVLGLIGLFYAGTRMRRR
ncbi:MAG: cobaltochelatase subunit CobN [Deltaproteobacteria bacterium]